MIKAKDAGTEGAEFGVDSKYSSKNEKIKEGTTLMEARLRRMRNLTDDQIIKARLLQLKLKMEEFIKEPYHQESGSFTDFLANYVDTVYQKRKKFASDIGITPVLLSQILNGHREPKEEFILRLMVHSEKTYMNVCPFNTKIWYQVFYQERLSNMMANQNEWKPEIEKFVHVKNLA